MGPQRVGHDLVTEQHRRIYLSLKCTIVLLEVLARTSKVSKVVDHNRPVGHVKEVEDTWL